MAQATSPPALKWAVPVAPDAPGAHLEAYVNLLPTINTLRACHRFGQAAKIAAIPLELIDQIAGHLTQLERARMLQNWSADYNCYHDYCQPEDHFSREDIKEWREMIRAGAGPHAEWLEAFWNQLSEDQNLEQYIHDMENDCKQSICHAHYHSWSFRTATSEPKFDTPMDPEMPWYTKWPQAYRPYPDLFFPRNRELMLEHFGLEIWIDAAMYHDPELAWGVPMEPNRPVTLACLTLPELDASINDILDARRLRPSDAMRKRFMRCMRILGLTPVTHANWQEWSPRIATFLPSKPDSRSEATAPEGPTIVALSRSKFRP